MGENKLIHFDDVLGQTEAVSLLRHLCSQDRLPHALLFAGPAGVGKGTCAAALGAWFLCQKPRGDRPCGTCESCRVIPGGNHPDFHIVAKELMRFHDKTGKSKATLLSIDVIREELVAKAGRTSVMGRGKFFVIEEAELMSTAAQNAMLKTLEEPGGRTVIVLLSEAPHFLLPTVLSRCQVIRFARLDEKLVAGQLVARGFDAAAAKEAADLADGSLGGALRMISDGTLGLAKQLCGMIDEMLGGKPAADLAGWLSKAAAAYADKQLERDELASKDAATRAGLGLFLHIAAERLRKRLHDAATDGDRERACTAIDAARQCQMYLDANVNVPVALGEMAGAWGSGG
jgi:DNA polymerase III subunit delta'